MMPPTAPEPTDTKKNKKTHPTTEECRNLLCNHKTAKEDPTPVQLPNIREINTIDDLITLGKSYHCKKNTKFSGMSLRLMCNLISPLSEFKNLIGMSEIKENMVNQILHFLREQYSKTKCGTCVNCCANSPCINKNMDMMHTVITGPPGVGKTEVGKILGKVYKELEVLSVGHFTCVSRADLIGEYLGHTAIKTQEVIDKCNGGILFIDEAYSLGSDESRDSFSKECIDTLNKNLSERRDFLCIIAGYKDKLEKCFFVINDGLKRRFSFSYDIKPYTYEDLLNIFELKVKLAGWKLYYSENENMKSKIIELFKKNSGNFPNYGGDIETLFLKCKIYHNKKCALENDEKRKTLSYADINNGLTSFLAHRKRKISSCEKNGIYA
jgi:ATPases of the AAA+ class